MIKILKLFCFENKNKQKFENKNKQKAGNLALLFITRPKF